MDYIAESAICDLMANIDVAIQQQVINQRVPLLFTSDGATGSAQGKVFTQSVLDGANVYFGSGGLGGSLQALDLNSPFNVKDLMMIRGEYWNEGLAMLGVNNAPADQKRERMNIPEVESNSQLLNAYMEDALGAREMACEAINEVFGLTVSVHRIEDEPEAFYDEDEYDDEDDGEDEEDGKI